MKLWIDTDCGIDDATAILICLANPNIEIVGISCIGGNASLQNVIRNVNRTLKVWGKTDIPIYGGCQAPLVQPKMEIPHIHGNDGLGDINDNDFGTNTPNKLEKEHAINALIHAANTIEDLNILCLAPLTNIAIALRMAPEAILKIKHFYIMGGAEDGKGNITPYAEFNWRADPEAAHIVLQTYPQCQTTIASWTLAVFNSFNANDYDFFNLDGNLVRRFIRDTWKPIIAFDGGRICPADPLAAFIAVYGDKAIKRAERLRLSMVLEGEKLGMSLAEPDEKGCLVVKECDADLFVKIMRELQDHQ